MNNKTLVDRVKCFWIYFGNLIKEIGIAFQPDYWKCTECDNIELTEREIICWKCGRGEMIYKGSLQ